MRSRHLLALATVLAALIPAAPAPAAELGLNINGGAAAGKDPQDIDDLGPSVLKAGWARHFLDWDNFEFGPAGYALYQDMLDREARLGVKTLISVKSAGNAAPDPRLFAARMKDLAQNLKGVEAFEIWNEADIDMFWSGGASAAAYTAVLKQAYPAVKSVSDARVVFSPTVGNNYKYLSEAYAAGAGGYFDAMAVHTDTACLDRSPHYFYREPDGRLGQFTFLGYREVRKVMEANGDGAKPIWMTEFGWSATTDRCHFGDKPAGVSEELQAQYLLEAMNCLERDRYVEVAMWFNNRDLSRDGSMANSYGLRRANNTTRPAFDAFKTWSNGGGRSSAPCGDFEGPTVKVHTPGPGFVLAPGSNMTIRASSDARDLNRIWFRVEGPGAAPLFNDGPISLPGDGDTREREWGGARDLGNGEHRLIVWATDDKDNPGPEVEIPFGRGAAYVPPDVGGTGPGSLVQFRALRLQGRGLSRTFRGGSIPGITSGAVRIEWQLKRGRRWKRMHAKAVLARRPFVVRQKLRRAGLWRVRAVYLGRPGIPRTASCWTQFRSSSTKTSVVCPRGAVKPIR